MSRDWRRQPTTLPAAAAEAVGQVAQRRSLDCLTAAVALTTTAAIATAVARQRRWSSRSGIGSIVGRVIEWLRSRPSITVNGRPLSS